MNNDTLQQLVEEAYRLFANYTLGNEIAVCTGCCLSQSEVKTLQTTQLANLDPLTVCQYMEAVESGSDEILINQVRYLLPRVLELLVAEQIDEYGMGSAYILKHLHCDNELWTDSERNFLQRFAKQYLQTQLEFAHFNDIVETVVMFDRAKLESNTDNSFIQSVFDLILKNADNVNTIEEVIGMVSSQSFSCYASDELDLKFSQFFQSDNFKNAFLNAILRKVESDDYDTFSQDEINLYEVAFSVFSNI